VRFDYEFSPTRFAAGKPLPQKNRGCNFKSIRMQMIFNGMEQGVKPEEKGKRGRFDFGDKIRRIPVVPARECNTVSYEGIEARTQAETPPQLLRIEGLFKIYTSAPGNEKDIVIITR
jgi:hypothetical protein